MDSNNRQALKTHIVEGGGKLPPIASTRFEVMYATDYEQVIFKNRTTEMK